MLTVAYNEKPLRPSPAVTCECVHAIDYETLCLLYLSDRFAYAVRHCEVFRLAVLSELSS